MRSGAGARIGKYKVLKDLGQGAMGRVVLAEDPDIGRHVAIKILLSGDDEDARRRFEIEARAVGNLSHPHIVVLLEYGYHDHQPYLVMEYLDGASLEEWLESEPSLEERLRVLDELIQAVEHAHRDDVLHRDLKPTNLQILKSGSLKLLDFGIARLRSGAMTATGMVIGTPEFMAPEVVRSATYSKRSDGYAVALIGYRMLAGLNPFRAGGIEACLHRVLTLEPEPLGRLRSDLPPELCQAVMAWLDKDPEKRPADFSSMRAAIARARGTLVGHETLGDGPTRVLELATPPPFPAHVSRKGSRVRAISAIALVFAVVSGVGWWVVSGPAERPPEVRSSPIDGASGETGSPSNESLPRAVPEEASGVEMVVGEPSPSEPEVGPGQPEAGLGSSGPSQDADAPDEQTSRVASRTVPRTPPPPVSATENVTLTEPLVDPSISPPENSPGELDEGLVEASGTPPESSPESSEEDLGVEQGRARSVAVDSAVPNGDVVPSSGAQKIPPPSEDPSPGGSEEGASADFGPFIASVRPGVLRKGQTVRMDVEGLRLTEATTILFRRGRRPAPEIQVVARRDEGESSLSLTIRVDLDIRLGTYSLVAVDESGRESTFAVEVAF